MSSEEVAKVARDVRLARAAEPPKELRAEMTELRGHLFNLASTSQVIDATPMYEQIVSGPSFDLYEQFQLMPVWRDCLVGYRNHHGNVSIIQSLVFTRDDAEAFGSTGFDNLAWETDNPVDWNAVTYHFVGFLWMGGRARGEPMKTVGPVFRWDVAVYEDGSIADAHWSDIMDIGSQYGGDDATGGAVYEIFQNAMLTWFQVFTLGSCVNVELTTPKRPKSERKRLDRIGVAPKTLLLTHTSKSYRHGDGKGPTLQDQPLSFVRGHFAKYGPEYGRGLLFGRLSGKFWIPAHARGEVEQPEREIDYEARPEESPPPTS